MRKATSWSLLFLGPAAVAVACTVGTEADTFPADPPDSGTSFPVLTTGETLHVVRTVNDGEIAAATVARSKATSPAALAYAATMIEEHTPANERVATLAKQRGVLLVDNASSQKLKAEGDAMIAAASRLGGSSFDPQYIADQVTMHRSALTVIDGQLLPNAIDADLRTELTTTRATVSAHLGHAQELADGGLDTTLPMHRAAPTR